jgi:hypothetical protein
MKLQHKLNLGFGAIILILILVGGIAIWANQQIVFELERKQDNFRSMIDAADAAFAISKYSKSAESHLMLYLNLHENGDLLSYSEATKALENQIYVLQTGKYDPEGQGIIYSIMNEKDKLLSRAELLLALDGQNKLPQNSFLSDQQEKILAFHDATSTLRRLGIEFIHYSTNFLNKQIAITAAAEVSSYASRAAGHLMLYLTLQDTEDREKFFLRIKALEDQIGILEKFLVDAEGRSVIEDMKTKKDGLLESGIHVLSLYNQDMEATGLFLPAHHRDAVLTLEYNASSLQTLGAQAEKHIIDSEIRNEQSIIKSAGYFQLIIFTSIICGIVISLIIGYRISRKFPRSLEQLEK